MATPEEPGHPHNITTVLVAVVVIAMVIIAALTVTAILTGPPAR